MGQIDFIKEFIKQEENQKKINRVFIVLIGAVILYGLIIKASFTLLDEPLFFFTSDAFELTMAFCFGFMIYYIVLPKESFLKKAFIVLVFLFILFAFAYLKDLRRGQMLTSVWSEFSSYIGMTFIFTSLFYFFDNLNLFVNNSYVLTKKALHQAENKLLRQQFNPHFLFNAFNSLYSMSLTNNPKTPESILRMSGMMRYITDEVNVAKTPLSRELKFIDDYVKIEQLRFGGNANIKFEIEGSIEDIFIEPLLLITLVENAFKHGFYTNDTSSFVHMKTEVSTKEVHFIVTNNIAKKQHFQSEERNGKGLDLLQKRLSLSYGKNASLDVQDKGSEFCATLKIDLG